MDRALCFGVQALGGCRSLVGRYLQSQEGYQGCCMVEYLLSGGFESGSFHTNDLRPRPMGSCS